MLDAREQAVLDALRKDRDECGPGLAIGTIASVGSTRWPERLIARLSAAGFVIGVRGDMYELGHEEHAASTGTPGDLATATPPSGGWEDSSGVPVGIAPRSRDLPRSVAA